MTDSAVARRIDVTGWSSVVLGAVCLALAAFQAIAPFLLRRFASVLAAGDDPLREMREAWAKGAVTGAWVNGIFGLALIVIGVAVSRRARWAHGALTISCWASIAVLAILARPTLAPFFAMTGTDAGAGYGMMVASAALLLAQIGAVLWFLRFWSKPDVRDAFR
jgi:hypothetical protein